MEKEPITTPPDELVREHPPEAFERRPPHIPTVAKKIRTYDPSRLANWATALSLLVGLLGVAVVAINKKIDRVIEQRIEPYELLQQGVSLVNDEEYARAIPALDSALQTVSKQNSAQGLLLPISDYYVFAIVNDRDPKQHEHRMKKILEVRAQRNLPNDAYLHQHLAWFQLRTNQPDSALHNFSQAIAFARANGHPRLLGDSYWGSAMAHLALGNPRMAVEQAHAANRHSPGTWDPATFGGDARLFREDVFYRWLADVYGERFNHALAEFLGALRRAELTQQ